MPESTSWSCSDAACAKFCHALSSGAEIKAIISFNLHSYPTIAAPNPRGAYSWSEAAPVRLPSPKFPPRRELGAQHSPKGTLEYIIPATKLGKSGRNRNYFGTIYDFIPDLFLVPGLCLERPLSAALGGSYGSVLKPASCFSEEFRGGSGKSGVIETSV